MISPKTLLAFIGGAAAGAAIYMLFNSEKGNQLRKDITDKARNLADSVLEKAEEMINEAEEASRSRSGRS